MQRLLAIARPWDLTLGVLAPVYLSDGDYTSGPGDTPANTIFQPRLIEGYDFETRLWSGAEPGGSIEFGDLGRLRIANADGALDAKLTLTWDGRALEIYTIAVGAAFSTATLRVAATIERLEWDESGIDVILRSPRRALERDLERSFYGGTGGLDGDANLAGLPKPLLFGAKDQIPAPIIDTVNLIGQIHDGPIDAVTEFRDAGVVLPIEADVAIGSLVATSVTAGMVKTALDGGAFKLGSAPSGLITCDARGDKTGGTWASNAAELVERIVKQWLGVDNLASGDLDAASFSALSAAQPAVLGEWIGLVSRRADDLIERLMATIGGVAFIKRNGKLAIWRLEDPADLSAVRTLDATRLGTGTPLRQRIPAPPAWRRRVAYRTFARAQSPSELAGSVSDAKVLEWGTARRFFNAEAPLIPRELATLSNDDPQGVTLKADGTAIYYVVESPTEKAYQVGLGVPWSLVGQLGQQADYTHGLGGIQDLRFKADGTKLYLLELTGDAVLQYPLSTAWDLSTVGSQEASHGVSADGSTPRGFAFKADGTKLYVVFSDNDTVFQYPLTGAWDLATAGASEASEDLSAILSLPTGIAFKSDGTKIFAVDRVTDTIEQWGLATAWDLTSVVTHEASFSFAEIQTTVTGLDFSADGTKFYICGEAPRALHQFELEVAWDVSTVQSTVQAAHALARDVESLGLFHAQGDPLASPIVYGAETEAIRLGNLHGVEPRLYTWSDPIGLWAHELGDVVTLQLDRFALAGGRNFVVRAISENWRRNETILELWGRWEIS